MLSDAASQRQRASMLIGLRRPAEARAILEPLVATSPHDAGAVVLLASCCQLEGDDVRALDLCRRAVASAPDDTGILLDAAGVARFADGLKESHVWASKALAIAPNDLRALNMLTLVESALGKRFPALSHGRQALAMAPDNVDLRVAYAVALGTNRQYVDATEQYALVLEQEPNHVYALNNLAALRLNVGDLHRSAWMFGRAIAIDPRLGIATKNLDVAGAQTRRVLLTRFAVAMGAVGVAMEVAQTWAWGVAALLLGWTVWSASRVPVAILRRVTARIQGRELFGFLLLAIGLLNTFGPMAGASASLPGYLYLFGYGLLFTVGILAKRARVDFGLRRRGIRLPR